MAPETLGASGHAALMDEVYRGQRHIYDFTRKYYLFGRDTLIAGLAAAPGMRVLEVACGTGRNLAKIGRAWPGMRLFGLDISAEMLKSARAALGDAARLGQGDACAFDAQALLGEPQFDRIVLSYSLSMIPDWGGRARSRGWLAGRARAIAHCRFRRSGRPAPPVCRGFARMAGQVPRCPARRNARCCGTHSCCTRPPTGEPARAAGLFPAPCPHRAREGLQLTIHYPRLSLRRKQVQSGDH
jgi:SAM-dependent methyltransferase